MKSQYRFCLIALSALPAVILAGCAGVKTTTTQPPPTTYQLSVTAPASGAGTIASSPAGISCPGTCSASFAANMQVTLTETRGNQEGQPEDDRGGGRGADPLVRAGPPGPASRRRKQIPYRASRRGRRLRTGGSAPPTLMSCTLCGLPSGEAAFCCAGCENVYAILVESGVVASGQNFRDTDLFQQSLKLGLISTGVAVTGERPVPPGAETREAVFHIGGMWCTSCGWLIEHALTKVRGIAAAEVMFSSDLLKVRYCPQYVPPERIVERVASLGYRAAAYTGTSAPADAERKDLLLRVGIAAFLSMNVMMFSLVVYASYFEPITASYGRYIPFLLMALATPSVFYCAAPILRIAWAGARAGVLRMESLLAMGILMAYGYSAVQTFRGDNRVYFDTACAIVTLVLAGKAIERGAKQRAMRALTLLHRLMPSKARLDRKSVV